MQKESAHFFEFECKAHLDLFLEMLIFAVKDTGLQGICCQSASAIETVGISLWERNIILCVAETIVFDRNFVLLF